MHSYISYQCVTKDFIHSSFYSKLINRQPMNNLLLIKILLHQKITAFQFDISNFTRTLKFYGLEIDIQHRHKNNLVLFSQMNNTLLQSLNETNQNKSSVSQSLQRKIHFISKCMLRLYLKWISTQYKYPHIHNSVV